jgi:signal transduction histidine kinase/CheY-like chemotaxis protein
MSSVSRFFESVNSVFVKLDEHLFIEHCNEYTLTKTVCTFDTLAGRDVTLIFHEDDRDNIVQILTHPQEHAGVDFVHRWGTKESRFIWLKWQVIQSSDNAELYILGEDVSEQKRISAALKSIEKVTDTGYWEIDLDTGYLYWSDYVHRIHETDASTFKPKLEDGINFYHPDSIPELLSAVDELSKSGRPYNLDLGFISAKGKHLIVNAQGFSEKANGRVVRSFGTFKDLSKQKQDELERQSLEQRIVLALKAANIGVWEYDMPNDRLNWDGRMFEIYGRSEQAFRGTLDDWISTLHKDDLDTALSAFQQSLDSHTDFNHTFRVVTESGQIKHLHGMAAFIYNDKNVPIKATGINIDLSESVRINDELRKSTEKAKKSAKLAEKLADKAKAADNQKSAFLANMSHELRTPISGVIGLIDLIILDQQDGGLTEKERIDYLKLVKSSSHHLLNILSDILDFSKIEAGKIAINSDNFNLNRVLQDLIQEYKHQASEKGLSLDFHGDNMDGYNLLGDPHRLKQVLYNLLSNALKYTSSGSIQINTQLNKVRPDQVEFICSITDSGIGIEEDKKKLLFLPFEQLDTNANRRVQGTGLGLSITHRLIKLMQGEINVESTLGMGSTFTVKVPLGVAKTAPSRRKQRDANDSGTENSHLENFHVLVAEDNEINQVVVQSLLAQLNITCSLVEDGKQALEMLLETPSDTFQLVLMDCQMPNMDGFEATRRIRNDAGLVSVSNIPIIALTANAMAGDKNKCLQAGMDNYLAKPITKEKLKETILHTCIERH